MITYFRSILSFASRCQSYFQSRYHDRAGNGQRSSGCVHLNKNLKIQRVKRKKLVFTATLLALETIFRVGQEDCTCFSEAVKQNVVSFPCMNDESLTQSAKTRIVCVTGRRKGGRRVKMSAGGKRYPTANLPRPLHALVFPLYLPFGSLPCRLRLYFLTCLKVVSRKAPNGLKRKVSFSKGTLKRKTAKIFVSRLLERSLQKHVYIYT